MASKVASGKGSSSARPSTSRTRPRWPGRRVRATPARSMGSLRSTPTTSAPVRPATARAIPAGPVATSSTRPGWPSAAWLTTARRQRRSWPKDSR